MNPGTIISSIAVKLNSSYSFKSNFQLSISPSVSEVKLDDYRFASLVERFLHYVLTVSYPAKKVRIRVRELKQKKDLAEFFSVSPNRWLYFGIEGTAFTGFERGAKNILADLGYCCSEWVGMEESESHLGAFQFGSRSKPVVILFVRNHGLQRRCEFLFPVGDSL